MYLQRQNCQSTVETPWNASVLTGTSAVYRQPPKDVLIVPARRPPAPKTTTDLAASALNDQLFT